MYIKRTSKKVKGKTYTNHLLVESIATSRGPRHKIICSLGSLSPSPKEKWLELAHKIESALSHQLLFEETPEVREIVDRIEKEQKKQNLKISKDQDSAVEIYVDAVYVEDVRSAGHIHVANEIWNRLKLNKILSEAGLGDKAVKVTEAMVLNRLIYPTSELSMLSWIKRTAIFDMFGEGFQEIKKDVLYDNLDKIYPNRARIECELAKVEEDLFSLDNIVYLYDLTSTYFEGECLANSKAKRGYSRDKRSDCKQVIIGLVLGSSGFPKAHEIFDGNKQDGTTVDDMLNKLEERAGKKEGALVVVDRGMAFSKNLEEIKKHGYKYLVAGRQSERDEWLSELEEGGFHEVLREPSPRNPFQKKSKVEIKRRITDEEDILLCISEGRKEKDKAIREKKEQKLISDIEKLMSRVQNGRLVKESKIHEAIGRLKERYPRVARYYRIEYNPNTKEISCNEDKEKKEIAQKLDGSYILKTNKRDMTDEEIWKTYSLLTRVETAFRNMKSPLMERPIFHHLQRRVETHIFLCILAYHLLNAIEKYFLDNNIHTSWRAIKEQLETHTIVTVVLPTTKGYSIKIRKATKPDLIHEEIYSILKIPSKIIKEKKWVVRL